MKTFGLSCALYPRIEYVWYKEIQKYSHKRWRTETVGAENYKRLYYKMIRQKLNDRIKEAGLKQKELAKECNKRGVSATQGSIDEWEDNEFKLKGVALINIQRRIRAQYGRPYGLFIQYERRWGFCVRFRLPIVKNTEHAQ